MSGSLDPWEKGRDPLGMLGSLSDVAISANERHRLLKHDRREGRSMCAPALLYGQFYAENGRR